MTDIDSFIDLNKEKSLVKDNIFDGKQFSAKDIDYLTKLLGMYDPLLFDAETIFLNLIQNATKYQLPAEIIMAMGNWQLYYTTNNEMLKNLLKKQTVN